jgi:hypothetical protein
MGKVSKETMMTAVNTSHIERTTLTSAAQTFERFHGTEVAGGCGQV